MHVGFVSIAFAVFIVLGLLIHFSPVIAQDCSAPTASTGTLSFNNTPDVTRDCSQGAGWGVLHIDAGHTQPSSSPTNCTGIGNTCDDGSIYAGLSPDGVVPMYTTPADAPSTYTWNNGNSHYSDMAMENCTDKSPGTAATCQTGEANTAFLVEATDEPDYPFAAAEYCDELSAHGYSDWYLPAADELNVLYINKNTGDLNGTFDETGTYPAGYYWTSSELSIGLAQAQRFNDGKQLFGSKDDSGLAVRCVRR
jgi:hypothetical protein